MGCEAVRGKYLDAIRLDRDEAVLMVSDVFTACVCLPMAGGNGRLLLRHGVCLLLLFSGDELLSFGEDAAVFEAEFVEDGGVGVGY